ncbi:MAG: hypothetical protein ACP6IU_11700 [Candidatus Asgardarchaeia archaeon]
MIFTNHATNKLTILGLDKKEIIFALNNCDELLFDALTMNLICVKKK